MKHRHFGWLVGCALLSGWVCADEGWPAFRGPQGDGTAAGAKLPLRWSETENVRWKTALPHLGWSTPAVRDGRVWVTSATTNGQDYFACCVDAATGKTLFERRLFHCDKPEPLGNAVNCYASPSPAVDGERAYLHFGTYGTACLDAKTGATLWTREDLKCRHYRGPGSSPILYRDLLILTFDGVDVQYVAALDKRTGKTVWKTDRVIKWNDLDEKGLPKREGDFRKAFATPLVVQAAGREQLISLASSAMFSYDPATGRELWHTVNTAYTPSVSPVFGGGLVLAVTGRGAPELLGIRPDGTNDVTASHVAWRLPGKDVPQTPSPVVVDGLLYLLADHGMLTCLEAATGQMVWRERLPGNYIASLLRNGDRIYAFSLSGKTTVFRADRAFEKLADNPLAAGFMASPAVDGDALILRTKTHLYRIEAPR